MKRPRHVSGLAWLLFVLALLGGCSSAISPVQTPFITGAPAVTQRVAGITVLNTANVVTEQPSPPTSPTLYNGELHPGEYYVVERDGLKGVVDWCGREVLPIKYRVVSEVFAADGRVAFFADGQIQLLGGGTLTDSHFLNASDFMGKFIVACVQDEKYDRRYGVMSRNGEIVAPFQYEEIWEIGDGFLGAKGSFKELPRDVDVYNGEGKLLHSKKINYKGVRGSYIVIVDKSGKRWGLMDRHFNYAVKPEWTDAWPSGNGCFIVTGTEGNEPSGVIGPNGRMILPVKYDVIGAQTDDGGTGTVYYIALSARRTYSYLYDCTGKQLLRSDRYFYLSYRHGLLVRRDRKAKHGSADAVEIIEMKTGKVLAAATDIIWDNGFYHCLDGNLKSFVCDGNGKRLPLPAADDIYPITQERFILTREIPEHTVETGLYDAQGNALAPMGAYDSLEPVDGGHMLIYGNGGLFGIMDYDGVMLLPAKYEALKWYTGKSLIGAQDGSIHGLIDLKGNWVWSASGPFPTPTPSIYEVYGDAGERK